MIIEILNHTLKKLDNDNNNEYATNIRRRTFFNHQEFHPFHF